MNSYAAEAKRALTAKGYPTAKSLCQKFARLVVQSQAGNIFDKWLWKASAAEAGKAFLNSPYGYRKGKQPGGVLQPGDLLYILSGSGGYGHVGVCIGDGKVAENSIYHWKRTGKDSRGIRTLQQFGNYDVVVRLPDPNATQSTPDKPARKPEIILAHYDGDNIKARRIAVEIKDGRSHANVREVIAALGIEVQDGQWQDGTPALIRK
jgi:hypothetical protein